MGKGRGAAGLRPVQDVVSRIRFDAKLDAARFVVGYEERGAGIRESPLPLFVAGGDVPWHRVRYVKAGDLTVWDRQARVDLVFGTGDTPAADLSTITAPRPAAPPATAKPAGQRRAAFDPAACLRFDPATGGWVPAGPPTGVRVDAVQVATFNVLSDAYDRDLTYPDLRIPACVEALEGLGADVVALHEATPALWDALLAAAWVRAGYHVSAGPDPVAGYGTVLLTRWPMTLEVHRLSTYKRTVLGVLDLNGRRVGFVAAHLTSDHTAGAEQRREHQLRIIDERLGRGDLDGAVVLADLNFGDDTRPDVDGYTDPWRVLHPHDAGYTFDPAVNPLAALASVTGRPGASTGSWSGPAPPAGSSPSPWNASRWSRSTGNASCPTTSASPRCCRTRHRPRPPAGATPTWCSARRRCTRRRWCCCRRRRLGAAARRSARRTTRRSGAGCRT